VSEPRTEAGRALVHDHALYRNGKCDADVTEPVISAIEREAWLQGHDEAVRLQAEYDNALVVAADAKIAELRSLLKVCYDAIDGDLINYSEEQLADIRAATEKAVPR